MLETITNNAGRIGEECQRELENANETIYDNNAELKATQTNEKYFLDGKKIVIVACEKFNITD